MEGDFLYCIIGRLYFFSFHIFLVKCNELRWPIMSGHPQALFLWD